MVSLEIPSEVLIFLSLFIVVALYFLFFQQYLSALIIRLMLWPLLPKWMKIRFKRHAFSVISGGITFADVEIVTQDMSIRITKLFGSLYYWRKIPDFATEEKTNSRSKITIYGLEVTILNRTYATDLVETVVNMYKEGKSTAEVTEYLKKLYPKPEPYQLSMLYRMILPMEFHIYAASIVFGNPQLPAFLIYRAESMSGKYTLLPRQTPEHSLKSILTCDMYTCTFKYIPLLFQESTYFARSMRDIYNRSKKPRPILHCHNIEVEVQMDMFGLYVLTTDANKPSLVTKEPRLVVNLTTNGDTRFEYGPYTDKLRTAFMQFYAPFTYNDPIYYDDPRMRIKYWEVNVNFRDGFSMDMPFVTNENRTQVVKLRMRGSGEIQSYWPYYIANGNENKIDLSGVFNNIEMSTSLPKTPTLLTASSLSLTWGQFYPERWNDITQQTIFVHMKDVNWLVHPYHIDFLSQFGTDWASWYPFQKVEDTPNNFFPYTYFLTVVMEPLNLQLFCDWDPQYKFTESPESFSRADIETVGVVFKLSSPLIEFNEEQKSVSYSCEVGDSRVTFVHPDNMIRQIRRGIRFYDYVTMEKLQLSGAYKWCLDPAGDVELPVNIKIHNVTGLVTVSTIEYLVETVANYTGRPRLHPESWDDPPRPDNLDYLQHTVATISIDKGSIKIPIDMYDPKTCISGDVCGVLISLESYYPFFHVMVDIHSGLATLPRSEFEYDRYYDEVFRDIEGPNEGKIHTDLVQVALRSFSHFSKASGYADCVTQISCEINEIYGYVILPHLVSALELTWSIINDMLGDDTHVNLPYNPNKMYMIKKYRVVIGPITALLDMGSTGLVVGRLPAGVVVHADTIADNAGHTSYFIQLPVIDAHICQASSTGNGLTCIFRTTTYLNVVRIIGYDDDESDPVKQAEYLRENEFFSGILPFVDTDPRDLDEEYLRRPEMLRPSTYDSSLDDTYELTEKVVTDPNNNNEYTLVLPCLLFSRIDEFLNMDDCIVWIHTLEYTRFYSHNFPSLLQRNSRSDLSTAVSDIPIARVCAQRDEQRYHTAHVANNIVLPQHVIVQLKPDALINFAGVINSMNLKPDEHLLSKMARSRTSRETDLDFYKHIEVTLNLPQLSVLMRDDNFDVVLTVNNLRILNATEVAPVDEDSLTLSIDKVSVAASQPNQDSAFLSAVIPNIRLISHDPSSVVKIDPVKVVMMPETADMVKVAASRFGKLLDGFPVPTEGTRRAELKRLIESSPIYKEELEHIIATQYFIGETGVPQRALAEVSALFTTYRRLKIKNFTTVYQMLDIPPPPKKDGNSRMTVILPPVDVSLRHSKTKRSSVTVKPMPLVIESRPSMTAVTAAIQSINVNIEEEILIFVSQLLAQNESDSANVEPEKPPAPKTKKVSDGGLMVHASVHDIDISVRELHVKLGQASMAMMTGSLSDIFQKLSLTASFSDLSVVLDKYINVALAGVSLCQRNEQSEGMVHIKPISVFVDVGFLLAPENYIDLSFFQNFVEEQRSKVKPIMMTKKKPEKCRQKKASFLIEKLVDRLSATLIVSEIRLAAQLTPDYLAEVVLPMCSGLSYHRLGSAFFFCYIQSPNFAIRDYLSFGLADFLIHGSLSKHSFEALLMVGQVLAKAKGARLSQLLSIANTVLQQLGDREKKVDEPEKEAKKVPPKPVREEIRKVRRKFRLVLRFEMPKFAIIIKEIRSAIAFNAISAELMMEAMLMDWRAGIQEVNIACFNANLSTAVMAESLGSTMTFTVSPVLVNLPPSFLAKKQRLMDFVNVLQEGLKQQTHVTSLVQGISEQVHTKLENQAHELVSTMITQPETLALDVPTKLKKQFLIQITDVRLSLPFTETDGLCASIPGIALLLQIRESSNHDKIATAGKFQLHKFSVVLDSGESTSGCSSEVDRMHSDTELPNDHDSDNLSAIRCRDIEIEALIFERQLTTDVVVDGLTVELFPTAPSAVSKLVHAFSPLLQSNSPVKKEADTPRSKKERPITKATESSFVLGHVHLRNFEILISPIANKLPIPNVDIELGVADMRGTVAVHIPEKLVASLTPAVLRWIRIFKHNVLQLKESIPVHKEASTKIIKQPRKESNFSLDLIVLTHEIEVCLGCQPRRNDISCMFGLDSVYLVASTGRKCCNVTVKDIHLRTNNIFAPQTVSRTARLFEFNIPTTDIVASKEYCGISVEKVETSFSSDKIEEISLFSDIWIQPLTKTLSAEMETEVGQDTQPPVPIVPSEEEPSNLEVVLMVNSVDLFFNYAGGAGHLDLSIKPIRVQHSKTLSVVTVNTVSLVSNGQLFADFKIGGVIFIHNQPVSTTKLTLFGLDSIKVDMKMAEEPFFEFSLGKTYLFYRTIQRQDSPRGLLLLSLDSPMVTLTGLTVPTLRSFIRTVTDPILLGIDRANRSDEPKIVKKEKPTKRYPLNSKLAVLTRNMDIGLCRYDFKDNQSIRLFIKGIMFYLELSQHPTGEMKRKLRFKFSPISLTRRVQDAGPRDVLKLPCILGDLDTTQKSEDDLNIVYSFITQFDGSIEPSLNLSDYEMIVALIKYTVANIKQNKAAVEEQEPSRRSLRATAPVPVPTEVEGLPHPPDPEKKKYVFTPEIYQFNPPFKVGIGASISPDIGWLLARLGLSDEHVIPASLFEFVCLGLENFLRALISATDRD